MSQLVSDKAAAEGVELLQPGSLYTIGRLAVSCIRHQPGERPHLKLKLYPASFVESMNAMLEGGFTVAKP